MKVFLRPISLIILNLLEIHSLPEWENHDISTLKLLQIVHRHGERTPLKGNFAANDPFKNKTKFWSEGFGQLTTKGKYRMFKLGQFIRKNYDQYLGDKHSPREVYVRSSIENRCIESVSCLLAGAYLPNTEQWQWNNGSDAELGLHWQPIPIETFMPENEDSMLSSTKSCPNVENAVKDIMNSKEVKYFLKNYQKENMTFINNLFNEKIMTLKRGTQLWDTLRIELDNNYIWDDLDSIKQLRVVSILEEYYRLKLKYNWNTTHIKHVRVGEIIETLATNMRNIVKNMNNDNNYKLYLYSTHDTTIAPLLQALDVYNDLIPAYGSAILFELHQNDNNDYFIKIYYFNETFATEPFFLKSEKFNNFYNTAKTKWFIKDFNELCGITLFDNSIWDEILFVLSGIGVGILILGMVLMTFMCIKRKMKKDEYYFEHEF